MVSSETDDAESREAQPERLARNAEASLAGDPWSEPPSGLALEGMTIGEFGIVLKDFLHELHSKLGQVANNIYGFLRSTFGWLRRSHLTWSRYHMLNRPLRT